MKFLECEAILIQEDNPIILVEKVGRTCYKSEDKITEESARPFVEGLAKRHHFAMLEHGRVHFEITGIEHLPFALAHIPYGVYTPKCYRGEVYHYLTLSMSHLYQFAEGRDYELDEFGKHLMEGMWNCFFDTYLNPVSAGDGVSEGCTSCGVNIRVIKKLEDMVDYSIADFEKHHSYTFRYICDRGVSHELVRHRVALGQESTRYVAYDKAKYGAVKAAFDKKKIICSLREGYARISLSGPTRRKLFSNAAASRQRRIIWSCVTWASLLSKLAPS